MRRLLAFLAAGLLILAAVVIRNRLDAREADQVADGQVTGTIVCVPEAAAACDAVKKQVGDGLTVKVEEAGTTLDRLLSSKTSTANAGLDAWVAPAPYVQMVNEARTRESLPAVLGAPGGTIARTPVTMVIWAERLQALQKACPDGKVTWACIGTLAGSPGGGTDVNPTHPPVDSSATGLLVLAQASGQQLGRSDYFSNDLEDPAFTAWFQDLERVILQFHSPAELGALIAQGPASFDMFGVLESQAGPAVDKAARKAQLTVLYPEPIATADLVVAPLSGSDDGAKLARLVTSDETRQALNAAGWRVDGQTAVTGIRTDVALPATSQLPNAGTLQTLRQKWINR